jgi:hypothetical protein
MKKWFLVGVMLVMFCGTVAAKDYDFRKTNWGMSRQEVMKVEKTKPFDNRLVEVDNEKFYRIIYESSAEGYKCNIIYFFDLKDKLYEGIYSFIDAFESQGQYISVVKNFIRILSEKYGQPVNRTSILTNKISWKANNTSITLDYYDQDPGFFANHLTIYYKDIKNNSDL